MVQTTAGRRVRKWAGFIAAAALPMLIAAPMAAAAKPAPPRCPKAVERTLVTWTQVQGISGADLVVRTTSKRDPLTTEYTPDPSLVSGLARYNGEADRSLEVVVRRDARRRRVATLCSGDERIATLSTLKTDEIVGSASVNGRRVAWRTWRPGAPGRIRTATIRAGKLRAVHSASVPSFDPDGVSAAIHLLPSGTVAWQLGPRLAARAWVWPIGRKPIRLPKTLPRSTVAGPSIRLLDDRNVLVDDTVVAYRPATPRPCSKVIGASGSYEVGGWRVSLIDDGSTDDGQEFASGSTAVVCDPDLGRYVAVELAGYSGGTYVGDPSPASSTTLHRAGDWLLSSEVPSGEAAVGGPTVHGRNLVTGESFDAGGFVDIAGLQHPVEGAPFPGQPYGPKWTTGAVAAPGVLAWCSAGNTAPGVWLSDGNGTRRVGDVAVTPTAADPALQSCGLRIANGVLEWAQPRRQPALRPCREPTARSAEPPVPRQTIPSGTPAGATQRCERTARWRSASRPGRVAVPGSSLKNETK